MKVMILKCMDNNQPTVSLSQVEIPHSRTLILWVMNVTFSLFRQLSFQTHFKQEARVSLCLPEHQKRWIV